MKSIAKPIGRPPIVFDQKTVDKIIGYSFAGLPLASIGNLVGISDSRIWKELRENSEFSRRYEIAKADRNALVANTAFQMAVSGEHPTMTTFWLRTHCRWNDKVEATQPSSEFSILVRHRPID